MLTRTIRLPQIRCEGCENAARAALSQAEGVAAVRTGAAAGTVRICSDGHRLTGTGPRTLLAGLGYQPAR